MRKNAFVKIIITGFSKTEVAVSGNKCPNLLKKRETLHFYPVNRQNDTWISDSKKLYHLVGLPLFG